MGFRIGLGSLSSHVKGYHIVEERAEEDQSALLCPMQTFRMFASRIRNPSYPCHNHRATTSSSVIPALRSKVVGPALLLGPIGLIVAQGMGLELRLVRVDNLAAAVLAL
jgi:hypothetical protein